MDGDGELEAVAATYTTLMAFDATDGQLEWQSDPFPRSGPPTLRVANVDGDLQSEAVLLIGTSAPQALLVLDGQNGSPQLTLSLVDATALDTPDRDGNGIAEIVIGTDGGALRTLDPTTGDTISEDDLGTGPVDALRILEVAGHAGPVDIVAAGDRLYVFDSTTSQILLATDPLGTSGVGENDSIFAADIDGDGLTEVAVNVRLGFLVVELRNLVFEDGFESGDISVWSGTTP